jgi:Xaa-Pro aminopeptidase
MRYTPLTPDLFVQNRAQLVAKLPANAVALLCSNDILPTNADGTLPFVQNSDLFYLSGIDQEDSLLVLAPNHPDPALREVLFLKETSELIAIWEGYKYTKEHAQQVSGIKTVLWNSQKENMLNAIIFESETIYLASNEHLRNDSATQTANDRLIIEIKKHYPLHPLNRLAPILSKQRMIKSAEEIKQVQTAIDITEKGHRRLMAMLKPGVTEYELEAELIHEYTKNRAQGFAYTPIIASGASACVLHYIENAKACNDGELILLDVGAKYANYNADLTRVLPVNGRFTPRQKQVYQAVLNANKFAESIMKPGILWTELQAEVENFIAHQCVEIGLFSKTDLEKQDAKHPLVKKYFMHGNSHHLGLDVHDVWHKYTPLAAGMLLTNEPGMYLNAEGIGIRLENNILLTENGNVNLMKNIPIEIEEIEEIMNA